MRERKTYWTTFATSLCATLVLAACTSLPVSTVLNVREPDQGKVTVLSTGRPREGTVNVPIHSAQVDEQSARLDSADSVSEARPSSDAPPAQETTDSNTRSDQRVALFAIEPLMSPCCPLPTPDKAVTAAQNTPGVVAAELINDTTVRVRFDSTKTDSMVIASAINQASFMVTLKEEAAEITKAAAIVQQVDSN